MPTLQKTSISSRKPHSTSNLVNPPPPLQTKEKSSTRLRRHLRRIRHIRLPPPHVTELRLLHHIRKRRVPLHPRPPAHRPRVRKHADALAARLALEVGLVTAAVDVPRLRRRERVRHVGRLEPPGPGVGTHTPDGSDGPGASPYSYPDSPPPGRRPRGGVAARETDGVVRQRRRRRGEAVVALVGGGPRRRGDEAGVASRAGVSRGRGL